VLLTWAMPLVPVDHIGTEIFYEDSGAPPGSTTYTTVVIIHGTYFNGGVFKPTFPFAAQHNLRFVVLNQRDYAHSTPYSEDELKQLTSGDKNQQEDFIDSRVRELAKFLEWFIEKEAIPLSTSIDDRRSGGLSIMSWSTGNHLSLAFLARGNILPTKTKETLNRYLRSYIIYDASYQILGFPDPSNDTVWNAAQPGSNDNLAEFIPKCICTHYFHNSLVLDSLSASPTGNTPSLPEFCSGIQFALESTRSADPSLPPPPTHEILTQISDEDGLLRSQFPLVAINPNIYAKNVQDALVDDLATKSLWPNVTIGMLTCGKSLGDCVYGMWELNKLRMSGRLARDAKYRFMEDFNHMAQWFYPGRFTSVVAELV